MSEQSVRTTPVMNLESLSQDDLGFKENTGDLRSSLEKLSKEEVKAEAKLCTCWCQVFRLKISFLSISVPFSVNNFLSVRNFFLHILQSTFYRAGVRCWSDVPVGRCPGYVACKTHNSQGTAWFKLCVWQFFHCEVGSIICKMLYFICFMFYFCIFDKIRFFFLKTV